MAGVTRGDATNVLLVVNQKRADSMALANQYIHLRKIPPSNVVYLDFELKKESIGIKVFQKQILAPVLKAIEERELGDQIDYIVYSSGFPTRIALPKKNYLTPYLESTGQKYNIQLHAPWCSINSLTYFYVKVLAADLTFFELDSNQYFRRPVKDMIKKPFVGQTQTAYESALRKMRPQEYDIAAERLTKIANANPGQPVVWYQLARTYALNGQKRLAIEQLRNAVRSGWCYREVTEKDGAFSTIRSDEGFQSVVKSMLDEPPGMLPTRAFSHQIRWGHNGWPANEQDDGEQYFISTVLGVSQSIGGTATLQENLNQLEQCVQADGTRPDGAFFFAQHKDIRSRSRARQFDHTIKLLDNMGFRAEIIETTMPRSQDVLGASLGSAVIPWAKSGSRFVPGAICDNFTSYGGWFEKKQTRVTDYIKHGAAGASGAVYEPYTIPQKFPHTMIHVHYARGCTLGEAFYQSIASPRQMLIVGDPLCRPFAILPGFDVDGLADGDEVRRNFSIEMVKQDRSPPIARFDLYLDGKRIDSVAEAETRKFAIKDLSPGYHDLRIVGIADTLVAASQSERIGFTVRDGNKSVRLQAESAGPFRLKGTITVQARATVGKRIVIMHNSRPVAQINGKSGQANIACQTLGQGKTTLRAVVSQNSKVISSVPLEVEINP